MKHGLLLITILISHLSIAQVFTIEEVKDTINRFPVIHSRQHPDAAKRINETIGKDWGFDHTAKNPFENFAVMEEASFDYAVYANNDNVFSMVIESSYAACGLHINRNTYNFDAHTGLTIDENKLFGGEGVIKLKKAVLKSRKSALKAAGDDKEDPRADEYKACLAALAADKETDVIRMLIVNDGIRFWNTTCLEGTAYDFEADRSQGPHQYSPGQMLSMFTAYGYSLFSNPSTGPIQKLLRGTIDGKYPISLSLSPGKNSNEVGGTIVYDRVGEPINVNGTMSGNQFTFHELDASNNALSDIEVSWDGTKLTGSFTNLKSKKQMPFTASVVQK